MYSCTLCRTKHEGESEAVLFVNKYGVPRCLCPRCEDLIAKATSEDEATATEARHTLGKITEGMRDRDAMQVLRDVLDGKASADETEEDLEILEEYEELALTEEELAEEERLEEEERRKDNSFLSWLPVILIGAAAVGFLIWFFFFR